MLCPTNNDSCGDWASFAEFSALRPKSMNLCFVLLEAATHGRITAETKDPARREAMLGVSEQKQRRESVRPWTGSPLPGQNRLRPEPM